MTWTFQITLSFSCSFAICQSISRIKSQHSDRQKKRVRVSEYDAEDINGIHQEVARNDDVTLRLGFNKLAFSDGDLQARKITLTISLLNYSLFVKIVK